LSPNYFTTYSYEVNQQEKEFTACTSSQHKTRYMEFQMVITS